LLSGIGVGSLPDREKDLDPFLRAHLASRKSIRGVRFFKTVKDADHLFHPSILPRSGANGDRAAANAWGQNDDITRRHCPEERVKTIIIGVLLTAGLATAQNALWVNLSGDWRMSRDDRPEFSAPDFDDRAWAAYRLPLSGMTPSAGMWLRRSATLPDGADRTQLALTLGTINDVYVNGVRIGGTGGLSLEDHQIPRPLTFSISEAVLSRGNRLVMAIRTVWFFNLRGRWRLQPVGPFLITYRPHAPVDAGERHLRDQRHGHQVFTAMISIASAGLVLLAWIAERKRTETLWLVLFLAMLGTTELMVISLIWEDFHPLRWSALSNLGTTLLTVFFTAFTVTAMGLTRRWSHLAWWLLGGVIFVASGVVSATLISWFVPHNEWIAAVAILAVPVGWWLRRGVRQTAAAHLFAGSLLFASLLRFATFAATASFLKWSLPTNSLLFSLVAIPILIQMLLTLAADRRESQRLAAEMEAGRSVQQLLLASAATTSGSGYRVEAVYQPAQELGGDFHWSRRQPDGCLLVAVGDVSGKGLKAAILVSAATGKSDSPGAILAALNEGLAGYTGGGFVTCCCARFDADDTVTIANAGHPSPYRDGREVAVEAGLPLGVVAGVAYEESDVQGERFTLVSDGVVEAENGHRELFGFERTRAISVKSAREIAEAAKAWGQNDDITVVTVRRST
jgi:sigma-B regulation protein RsbU (phosphoserine phosphatase)